MCVCIRVLQFSECELELQYAVKDGLMNEYKALGFKGSRVGLEQEGYKLPTIGDPEWVRTQSPWQQIAIITQIIIRQIEGDK